MAQSKILIDSNSYFRLAQSINPLLRIEFCNIKKYCLYIIDGFEGEYLKSPRLKTLFYWADQEDYKNNRDRVVSRSSAQQKEIDKIYEFIWDASINYEYEGGEDSKAKKKKPPGPVDCSGLAVGKILKIPIVTDDHDMTMLALEFEIDIWPTLKLLKLMKDVDHIDLKKVLQVFNYLEALPDLPRNYRDDKVKFFPELS